MMIKLALIGKNIRHSKSQEIYESLLEKKIDYTLLDYEELSIIPKLASLLQNFHGISITSPYKKSFSDQVHISESPFKSVNTLKMNGSKIYATNTDYLACEEILKDFILKRKITEIHILGDGSMSEIVQKILESYNFSYHIYSRKIGNLEDIKLDNKARKNPQLVINTCAREYTFNHNLSQNTIFWDMNYALEKHIKHFASLNVEYIDGVQLLRLQAKYALSFWNLIDS